MKNSSDRIRAWKGPGILSYGYRPFFLLAAVWAALAMLIWVFSLAGALDIPSRFDPVSWHAHEFLFGYLTAVIAGFLLTAVPNWTGNLPIIGWRLAGLVAFWVAGRIAISLSLYIPVLLTAIIDLSFMLVLAISIAREIIAGKNWRNLIVLVLLVLMMVANGLFHYAFASDQFAADSAPMRLGIGVAVLFISLIGGRIVPSFTRNWLAKRGAEKLPAAIGLFDRLVLVLTVVAVTFWAAMPNEMITAFLFLLTAAAHFIRLSRWCGWRSSAEPLVWILHVGYGFVPLGFLAMGMAVFMPDLFERVAAQHVWMVGAISVMTMAVMTRASLGHAGRPLKATRAVTIIYGLLIASVVARFTAGFFAELNWLLYLSAAFWIAGFAGFSVSYWPILTQTRDR